MQEPSARRANTSRGTLTGLMLRSRALWFARHCSVTRRDLALAATLCSSAPTAYAMEPHDRVVIVGSATSPLVRRLREESEALGFAVTVKLEETDLLADELAGPGVVAAIRLVEQPTESLELVIDDPKLHHV